MKIKKLLTTFILTFFCIGFSQAVFAHGEGSGIELSDIPDEVDFNQHYTDSQVAQRGFVEIDGKEHSLSVRTPFTKEEIDEVINIPVWLGVSMVILNVIALSIIGFFFFAYLRNKKASLPKFFKKDIFYKVFRTKIAGYSTASVAVVIMLIATIIGEGGAFWDIWQHILGLREALVSPPHSLYYFAAGIVTAVLLYTMIAYYWEAEKQNKEYSKMEIFPGFEVFSVSFIIFVLGGLFDNVWHAVLFVEHRLSLTHFVAEFGAELITLSLFVFGWNKYLNAKKSKEKRNWLVYSFIALAWALAFLTVFRIGTFYPIRNWHAASAIWHNYGNMMYEPAALFLNSLHFAAMFVLLYAISNRFLYTSLAVILTGLGLMIFTMTPMATIIFIAASVLTSFIFLKCNTDTLFGYGLMGGMFSLFFYLSYYLSLILIFEVTLPLPMDDFIAQVWEPPLGASFYAFGTGVLGGVIAFFIAKVIKNPDNFKEITSNFFKVYKCN